MSDLSKKLLQSAHRGVHEQFDMLAAAMHVQMALQLDELSPDLGLASPRQLARWVKEQSTVAMRGMGHSPGFLKKRLVAYVFRLYEEIYDQYTSVFVFQEGTARSEIQYSILLLAAEFLDHQYLQEGRADVCTFLKQNVRLIADKARAQRESRKVPPHKRDEFASLEEFEEALGFWHRRVGRIRGLADRDDRSMNMPQEKSAKSSTRQPLGPNFAQSFVDNLNRNVLRDREQHQRRLEQKHATKRRFVEPENHGTEDG